LKKVHLKMCFSR